MATRPSSLIDDADFGSIGMRAKRGANSAGVAGSVSGFKVALIVIGFLAGGAGIAYFYWPDRPVASATPGGKGSLNASDQDAAKKQQKQREDEAGRPGNGLGSG